MAEWPHAPARREIVPGTYIVTAGTLYKQNFFHDSERLDLLQRLMLTVPADYGWQLQCWAIFSNHYHFIASANSDGADLGRMLRKLHGCASIELNRLDNTIGRPVWYRYWDTRISHHRSYFARLAYVHRNPVKHGLVPAPEMYKWCSADWFTKTSEPAFVKTVLSFKSDTVNVFDDF